jgi:nitrile hydratase
LYQVGELGLTTGPEQTPIVVLENTPSQHNVVVCTLCSCYPSSLLGLPPTWYKSPPYRSRVVREPRAVLREMGLEVPEEIAVRVWDSSTEIRYLVLPERPAGTDGWSEEQLAALVTRDALIGVARAKEPGA